MKSVLILFALFLLSPFQNYAHQSNFLLPGSDDEDAKKKKDLLTSATVAGLKFRSIGPALTSGRVVDFAVNPKDRSIYFVAVACGGVWRTTNSGTTFEPVFDGQKSFSIGCIAIDPNNPHVAWIGTGENNSQRSVSYGDGVYRSDDDGKTWKQMGLAKSEHIGKIIIDPKNSNIVYVAAQGPLWGPGGDLGLYKTTDAGKTWNAILSISENTGVNDVLIDPRDSNILYASSYQRRRHVWTLINGGPESNLFKSTNGGATWDTLRSGIPSGDKGRIGLAISPVNPDFIFAIIELPDNKGGIFRSTNRGGSWEKRSDYVSSNPQYYQEILCDPKDVDRIYSLDTFLMVSDEGGKTMHALGNRHRHVDDHAMWIDPENTNYYLVGGDGGVYESFDRGVTWRYKENLPVTQFYRVSVDNAEPFYNVYGGTQDNASLGGPSRTIKSDGIMSEDWFYTQYGDGFKSQIDWQDPNIVYAQAQYGDLVRFDKKSGERIGIQPMPGKDEAPYRWNWDSPLIISSHNHTSLYFAANKLFKSTDRGDSWNAISGDLTRQIDRNSLPVMGKIWTVDAVAKNVSTSFYGNIIALDESPMKAGLIYAGTDDGLIQITEDDGATWWKIEKISGVPEKTYVSFVKSSQHDAKVVYAAFDNHKMADFKPYLFKSNDNGKSWNSITGNLPENGAVYCIAEDHVDPNLLFAGTEFGVFFTIDGGKKWIQLKAGLPSIAVRDIAIQKRENDLILATFGRSFYILDDYTPLRTLKQETVEQEAYIFPIKDALMFIQSSARSKGAQGETFFTAENPPFGATFTYYLKEAPKTKKDIRIESEKESIKKKQTPPYPTMEQLRMEDEETKPYIIFNIADAAGNAVRTLTAPAFAGVQRITWDLRFPDLSHVREQSTANKGSGMLVMPGEYTVSLSTFADGKITELVKPVKFNAKVLNNTSLPANDRATFVAYQQKVSKLQRVVLATERSANDLKSRLGFIKGALEASPNATEQMKIDRQSLEDRINKILRQLDGDRTFDQHNENQAPSIVGRIQDVMWNQWASTSAPTKTHMTGYQIVSEQIAQVLKELKTLVEIDLKKLETQLESIGAPWTPGRIPEWDGK